MKEYFVDTHAHLDMLSASHEIEDILSAARENGVAQILTIGIDLESSGKAVSIAERYKDVYAAVGVHPHDAINIQKSGFEELISLSKSDKVVAWGEVGLDYAKKYTSEEVQKDVFERQVEIALKNNLPLIIHDRDAHADVFSVLDKFSGSGLRGVFHCYSGDTLLAEKVFEMGFYISITGVVTFKNAEELRLVVKNLPIERIMLETDSPFLSPVPYRGKENEPSRVRLVAEKVAEIKSLSVEEVAECTSKNVRDLFGLPLP